MFLLLACAVLSLLSLALSLYHLQPLPISRRAFSVILSVLAPLFRYSVRDECFYAQSELVDGKAPTGAEVAWVAKEQSYFFRLSAWAGPLLDFYERNPSFLQPPSRRNEVLSFVRGGLRDLSVSRTGFGWGVPVPPPVPNSPTRHYRRAAAAGGGGSASDSSEPVDPSEHAKHIMYVWVDALSNYLSGLGWPAAGNSGGGVPSAPAPLFDAFWPRGESVGAAPGCSSPSAVHIVGKDILRFHAVYWPALLLAAGLPPPTTVFAHGWWTRDGAKISKSVGNVVDPQALAERFGVDQVRAHWGRGGAGAAHAGGGFARQLSSG